MAGDADNLTLLHDHYKETFSLIREREGQRDRLFLWLLVIFALLAIEIQYPANFNGVLGHLNLAGNNIDLQQLPLSRLLNASWMFTAAFVLKSGHDPSLPQKRLRRRRPPKTSTNDQGTDAAPEIPAKR